MTWPKWVILADLAFSALILAHRSGTTRTYNLGDVLAGVIELGIIGALVVIA